MALKTASPFARPRPAPDPREPAPREADLVVEPLGRGDARAWEAYVDAHPDANVYHLLAWKSVAERAYGMRAPFLIAREGSRGPVRGVLPLFVVGGPLNRYVTNGLFGSYGHVLADGADARNRLLDEARRITEASRSRYLLLKSVGHEILPDDFDCRDLCVIATLPLDPDPQAMWRGFRDKIRNCIRKAQKNGVEVRFGNQYVHEFYDVLAENMHRKGTPIYGFPVMRELLVALGSRAEVVTLWKDRVAISGAIVLYHKGTTYVPFASSRPGSFKLSPNNLLYWEIIRRSCLRGMKVLDFGRSARDSTTLQFKLGWRAQTLPQPFFVHTARGHRPPALDVDSPAVRALIKFWQNVPRPLADVIGPGIYRRFLA